MTDIMYNERSRLLNKIFTIISYLMCTFGVFLPLQAKDPLLLNRAKHEFIVNGDALKADALLQEYFEDIESRESYQEVLYAIQEMNNFSSTEYKPIVSGILEKNNPFASELIVKFANKLEEEKKVLEAGEFLHDSLQYCVDDSGRAEVCQKILQHHWVNSEYKDQDFLSIIEEMQIEEDVFITSEYLSKAGLATLRSKGNVVEAINYMELAASYDAKSAKSASADLIWMKILNDANNRNLSPKQIEEKFNSFIIETQGGKTKLTNIEIVAWYIQKYASTIYDEKPDIALAICNAISADPVYGKWGAKAKYLVSEWSNQDLDNANETYQNEVSANKLKESAVVLAQNGKVVEALEKIEVILTNYGNTKAANDAVLRKGYIFLVAEDKRNAFDAFQDALRFNSELGDSHPYNLESKYRMKQINHSLLYNSKDAPFENPTKNLNNINLLESVSMSNSEWLNSIPTGSPDIIDALLEEGGILFEQAMTLDSDKAWSDVREFLKTSVVQHEHSSECQKSLAELMYLETFFHQENYDKVVELGLELKQNYPKCWRELGSASLAMRSAYVRMEKWDEANNVMKWVRENIPEDALYFQGANYHVVAILDAAGDARSKNDIDTYIELRRFAEEKYPDDRHHTLRW